MFAFRCGLAVLGSLVLMNACAAVDPVSWSLSPSTGFPQVIPGESSSVDYTLTVHPKFPGSVILHTKFVKSSNNFAITDGCNNHSVKPGSSCTVHISYTASGTPRASIQMSYQYDNNVIPLPALGVSGGGVNEGIVGTLSGLPATISISPLQTPVFTVTYTNTSSADITGFAGNAAGSNLLSTSPSSVATVTVVPNTNSCGTSSDPVVVKPGKSCSVQGEITPVSAGTVTVSGLFTYNNGASTSNPSKNSLVTNSPPPPPGDCLSGEATLPFQNPTIQYADNVLQFTYKNSCATPTPVLGTVSFTPTGTSSGPVILGSPNNVNYDNCSGRSISGHSSCTVLVSVVPQNPGTLTVTASVDGVNATSTTTVNAPAYTHNVTFVNQCPFPVWYGVTTPSGSPDPTPSPSPSAYLLAAQTPGQAPISKTISFGSNSYFGTFLPRTGCVLSGSSFTCATGDCVSGVNGQCSGSAYEPFTRVEEVFPSSTTQGIYDISLENGPTVPTEFKGLGPSSNQVASPAASFVCSGAGAPIPLPFNNPPYLSGISLGNAGWSFTVPNTPAGSSPLYNFVSNDTTVSDCSSCASPNVCGLAYATTAEANNTVLACGKLLGYWSLTQLGTVNYTGSNPAYNPATVFQFNTLLTPPAFQAGYPSGTTAFDLYSCTPQGTALNTCYPSTASPASLCCGAHDWNATNGFSPYLTAQSSNSTAQNPDWLSTTSLPITPYDSILWLKLACPTCYSYQYDDPASSFNCNYSDAAQSIPVSMDFEVVFCPGGLTGNLSTDP
ncbi:thaumatin family protein [Legionella sp. CNM-4043-24]|uniref:thaumatin family protein n=1 Tax=Legionella sp. CNM-4043-24 TaxID=3421646 RepID=UPI00403AEBF1